MTGIFVESSENLGLLFNRYKDIPDVVDAFIQKMMSAVKSDDSKVDEDLDKFKNTCKGMMKSPEPINPRKVNEEKSKVKKVKSKVESLIPKLAKLHEVVEGRKANEGKTLSGFTSAVEWTKKVVVDLLNLCDQDLNLLSLVKTVYYRKIFEDGNELNSLMQDDPYVEDLMECTIDDISKPDIMTTAFDDFLESYIPE